MLIVLIVLMSDVLLCAGWYGWQRWQALDTDRQLAAARERWDRRPFASYHMQVQRSGMPLMCQQDVEITDEQIITVLNDTCQRSLPTVSDLFREIAQRDQQADLMMMILSVDQRPCSRSVDAAVVYHPELGYPQQIDLRVESRINWLSPVFWQFFVQTWGMPPLCQWTMTSQTRVTLQPLDNR